MINIERGGIRLGQVHVDGDSHVFHFVTPHTDVDYEIDNHGFNLPDFSSFQNLVIGDRVEFPLRVRAQNRYTSDGRITMQSNHGDEIVSIHESNDSLQLSAINTGTGKISIFVNGVLVQEEQIIVQHPQIPGVPLFWSISDSPVKLPSGLTPRPEANFICINTDENSWQMSAFTPEVRIHDLRREVQILQVTFSEEWLGLQQSCIDEVIEREKPNNRYNHGNYILTEYIDSDGINLLSPGSEDFGEFDFVWVDNSESEYTDIPISVAGSNEYTLNCRDSDGNLTISYLDGGYVQKCPIRVKVQGLNWDFSSTLNDYLSIQDVVHLDNLKKEITISEEVMKFLPRRLLFSDFTICSSDKEIEIEISWPTEQDYSSGLIKFHLQCNGEMYQHDLEVRCSDYSDIFSIQFDEEIDSKNSNLEVVEMSFVKRGNTLISLVIDYNEMNEIGYFESHRYRLSSANRCLAEFESNDNSIKISIPFENLDINDCRLEQIWHPYNRTNEIEITPEIIEISSDWPERIYNHEWLNFHHELKDVISDIFNGVDCSPNEVVDDWIYLKTKQEFNVSNIASELRQSLVIAFPHNGDNHIGKLYNLLMNNEHCEKRNVQSIGYQSPTVGDTKLPLICTEEMIRGYKGNQFQWPFLHFATPGIYILANAYIAKNSSKAWVKAQYFGPSDADCQEAYVYNSFYVFEVF